jgi:hypothetical protein
MTAAVFRAEFRRALPLLPWLLGLHAITLGLRTRWSGELTPRLSGVIEWGTWALALIVVVGSLWQDSPSRTDRFLASRPLRSGSLLSAKIAALLAMVALPFAFVEGCALVWADPPPRIVWLGILQTSLFVVVAVLAAFPFVWFWRNHAIAFTGLAVAFFAGAVLLRLFGSHPLNLRGPRWLGLDYLLMPPVLFAAMSIAGLLATASLILLRRQPHAALRIPIFAGCVCLALAAALWLRVRPVVADHAETAPLVSLIYTPSQSSEGYGTRLDISPPSEAPDPSMQRVRHFARVRINGRESLRWGWAGRSSSIQLQALLHSAPLQHALRLRFGDALKLPDAVPAEDEPASALIDNAYPPVDPLRIEAQIKETYYRWQVVADLPLRTGASATRGESRWTIEQATTYPDSCGGYRKSVTLQKRFPTIWLEQVFGDHAGPAIEDQFVLLEPSTGKMLPGSAFDLGNPPRPGQTDVLRSLAVLSISLDFREGTWWEGKTPEIDWWREHRLLILRPAVEKTVHHDWSSAGPILYPSKWLSIPYIDTLKSVRSTDPPLATPSDAAAVTRNGLGWSTGDLLFQDPRATGLTEEEWIAFFRLQPTAQRFRQLAGGVVPRPALDREADAWLAGYQVRLPNPRIDPVLELALARGRTEAPGWLHEAITRKRGVEPGFHAVWVLDSIRDAFVLPPGLKSETEAVDWFMTRDPVRFLFDPVIGKFQLR